MLASLTKAQKKVARTLIDLALDRECAKLIRKVSSDGITGGHYLEVISYLYAEGVLKEEDLEICDEEMKNDVIRVKSVCDSIR